MLHKANKKIAIIGGGIASAQLCYALAKRGFELTLYCQDPALAQGASKNRQGALYPLLQADDNALSEFYAQAYGYAIAQCRQLVADGCEFEHQLCGVLMQAYDQKNRQKQQNLLNCGLWSHLFNQVDATQASEICGIVSPHPGLFFPQGGWINPSSLIDALLKAARRLTSVSVKLNCPIDNLEALAAEPFDQIIIANGHHAQQFEPTKQLPLSPIRGQVSHLASTDELAKLNTVLCNNGYITPALAHSHCIGASFIKNDRNTELRQQEHINNLARIKTGFSSDQYQPPWLDHLTLPNTGSAAVRCVSIDHLPLVGAVPNHSEYQQSYRDLWKGFKPNRYPLPPTWPKLFILTALGARGLCSAPLAAEILAAQINNEAYPVSQRVLNALDPGRGLIKKLKAKND